MRTLLTSAEGYPIHHSPEPIAFSGTGRKFYDRYFFNGFNLDGPKFFGISFQEHEANAVDPLLPSWQSALAPPSAPVPRA